MDTATNNYRAINDIDHHADYGDALGVARAILGQIGPVSFIDKDKSAVTTALCGGVVFNTYDLVPFDKDGNRADSPVRMGVRILLTPADLYQVDVFFADISRNTRDGMVMHFSDNEVAAEDLPSLMAALDYVGEEVLNPDVF